MVERYREGQDSEAEKGIEINDKVSASPETEISRETKSLTSHLMELLGKETEAVRSAISSKLPALERLAAQPALVPIAGVVIALLFMASTGAGAESSITATDPSAYLQWHDKMNALFESTINLGSPHYYENLTRFDAALMSGNNPADPSLNEILKGMSQVYPTSETSGLINNGGTLFTPDSMPGTDFTTQSLSQAMYREFWDKGMPSLAKIKELIASAGQVHIQQWF